MSSVLKNLKVSLKKLILILRISAMILSSKNVGAQGYPFTNLPNTINATYSVNTKNMEAFKNQLLGYNIEGFSTAVQKDFIRKFDPISIRFPHGVWANFYDWETDGYQDDSYDNTDHQHDLDRFISSNSKVGIGGVAQLNTEKKKANGGKGYHMMWTYNINFDSPASCVARVKKDRALGLEVKDIELGNEHYWKNQRCNTTKTPEEYIAKAILVAKALKAAYPDIRVSLPLSWRTNHESYNKVLSANMQFFDAVTNHKYTGADPDVPGESNTAYESLLTAQLQMKESTAWLHKFAPGKPMWLTEWGVSAGSDVHGAACLGMADTYLYMSENQNIYDRANWFSFNKILNGMVVINTDLPGRQPLYPLQKRGYLFVYEILHSVLKDSKMITGTMNTATKLTTASGSVNSVSARLVTGKDGKSTLIAVNLTNKPVNFTLNIDGKTYSKTYKHEALVFDDLGVVAPVPVDQNVLKLQTKTQGTIVLPPLSISKVALSQVITSIDQELDSEFENAVSVYPNPSSSGEFHINENSAWEVYSSQGALILSGESDYINLNSYSKGIYFLKLNDGALKKIVIQ